MSLNATECQQPSNKHPSSIIMLGVVASNEDKRPSIWFKRDYRLTWRRKFFHRSRKSRRIRLRLPTKMCRTDWTPIWDFSQKVLALTITRFQPHDFSLWTHIENKDCKTRHRNTEELKSSMSRTGWSTWKGFARKVCKSFRPQLERVIAVKCGHSK